MGGDGVELLAGDSGPAGAVDLEVEVVVDGEGVAAGGVEVEVDFVGAGRGGEGEAFGLRACVGGDDKSVKFGAE